MHDEFFMFKMLVKIFTKSEEKIVKAQMLNMVFADEVIEDEKIWYGSWFLNSTETNSLFEFLEKFIKKDTMT